MEDLNINRDKPEMTDEQILKHKNFNAVLNTVSASKLPWYKTGKLWLVGGSAIIVITSTILLGNYLTNEKNVSPVLEEETSIIKNEIVLPDSLESKIDDGNSIKIVHVSSNTVVKSPLGIEIEVPNGVISESGIDKEKYDVRITSLEIPVGLDLGTHSKKECFKIDLSSGAENVELYGADAMMIKDEKVRILTYGENGWEELKEYTYIKEIAQIDSVPTMLKPVQNTTRPFAFGKEYNIKKKIQQFSEIAEYNNVVFQPNETWPDEWYEPDMWEDVEIDQVSLGNYRLQLKKMSAVKECDVTAVFDKINFSSALQVYNSSFSKTETTVPAEGSFFVLHNGGKYVVLYP